MTNHFATLSLTPAFTLDLAALEKSYFSLQRQYHPDRLVGKSAEERSAAISNSMEINQAYEALKSPLKRAQHLLALQGIVVGTDHDTVKPSHALLTQVMEWQEALMDAPESVKSTITNEYNATLEQLAGAFEKAAYEDAAHLTLKLQYLSKML